MFYCGRWAVVFTALNLDVKKWKKAYKLYSIYKNLILIFDL